MAYLNLCLFDNCDKFIEEQVLDIQMGWAKNLIKSWRKLEQKQVKMEGSTLTYQMYCNGFHSDKTLDCMIWIEEGTL